LRTGPATASRGFFQTQAEDHQDHHHSDARSGWLLRDGALKLPLWFLACDGLVCHHFHTGLAVAESSDVWPLSGAGKHRKVETRASAGSNYIGRRWNDVTAG